MKRRDFHSISAVMEGRRSMSERIGALSEDAEYEPAVPEEVVSERFFQYLESEGFSEDEIDQLLGTEGGLEFLYHTPEGHALQEGGGLFGLAGKVVDVGGKAFGHMANFAAKNPATAAFVAGMPGLGAGIAAAKGIGGAAKHGPGLFMQYQQHKAGKAAAERAAAADARAAAEAPLRMKILKAKARTAKNKATSGSGGGSGGGGGGKGGGGVP